MEKLVAGGCFLSPKSRLELNELKWEDLFVNFLKGLFLQLTEEDCAI